MTPPRPPLEGHQHSQPTAVGAVRHLDVPGGNQTMKSFLTQKARGKTSGSNQGSDVAGACCPTASAALTGLGENLPSFAFVFFTGLGDYEYFALLSSSPFEFSSRRVVPQ